MIKSTITPFGTVYFHDYDSPIGTSLDRYGQWAPAETQFLRSLVNEGDVVVDGGANVGFISLALADKVGSTGAVIAIEPSPDLLPLLQTSVRESSKPWLRVVPSALGSQRGRTRFTTVSDAAFQNLGMLKVLSEREHAEHVTEVEVVTIDSLHLDRLNLLKLDVEGQELSAIKGSHSTIKRCRPIITIELNELDRAVPIIHQLADVDYQAYFCSFPAFSPFNIKNESENIFGHASEAMIAFVPDRRSITPNEDPIFSNAVIQPFESLDQLATLFLGMPRYGDETDHERVPYRIIEERNEFRERLSDMTIASYNSEKAEETAEAVRSIQSSMSQLAESLHEVTSRQQRVIDRWERGLVELKMEQTALREALLGRAEDRAQLSLRIRDLEEDLATSRDHRLNTQQMINDWQSALHEVERNIKSIRDTLSHQIEKGELVTQSNVEKESRLEDLWQEHTHLRSKIGKGGLKGRLLDWLFA